MKHTGVAASPHPVGRWDRSSRARGDDRQIDLRGATARVVTGDGPMVRLARRRELRATGLMHARWLPSGFFVRLGARFLRTYHATFRASPAAIALVADGGTQPVGFLVGTIDNERHYRWVVRHRAVPLALVGVGALVADRQLMFQFVRTRLRRYTRSIGRRIGRRPVTAAARYVPESGSASGSPEEDPGPVAVLTHVAVAPTARGTGTGRRLVEAFLDHARATGAREARLVTPVSTQAPSFYRALGWRSAGRRTASDGTLVEEFRLSL